MICIDDGHAIFQIMLDDYFGPNTPNFDLRRYLKLLYLTRYSRSEQLNQLMQLRPRFMVNADKYPQLLPIKDYYE